LMAPRAPLPSRRVERPDQVRRIFEARARNLRKICGQAGSDRRGGEALYRPRQSGVGRAAVPVVGGRKVKVLWQARPRRPRPRLRTGRLRGEAPQERQDRGERGIALGLAGGNGGFDEPWLQSAALPRAVGLDGAERRAERRQRMTGEARFQRERGEALSVRIASEGGGPRISLAGELGKRRRSELALALEQRAQDQRHGQRA